MSSGSSGSVYQRVNSSGGTAWVTHVFWRESGRRRQTKKAFRTKAEAQAALAAMLASHQDGTFVEPTRQTVGQWIDEWMNTLVIQGRKRSTLEGYQRQLNAYVRPAIGDMALQDLKALDLDRLYGKLLREGGAKGRPLSLTSVHHVHAILNKLLGDAERKGLVPRNVARLTNAPSLATARSKAPEMTVWTTTELSLFLTTISGNRNEAMFRLLALTGMRRGEVVALRWADVDLAGRRVAIRQALTVFKGEEYVDSPKSRRSRRTIDIDAATVALLETHRARQAAALARVGVKVPMGDRVFTNDIGEPLRPDSIGQAFGRLVTTSGLRSIRLHDLRHTHASHLLAAGVNPKVVSERLGHSSVSFTMDVYAQVMPGQQAEAAEIAAALVGG